MKKRFLFIFILLFSFESLSKSKTETLDAKLTKFDSFDCSELNTERLKLMIKMNVLLFKNLVINMKLNLTIMIKILGTNLRYLSF